MNNTDPVVRSTMAAETPGPTLSVLIPTLNRPDDLEAAIRTLLRQPVLPQQLIIIDQSRTDESERRVRALFAASPGQTQAIELLYLRDTKIKGLAQARNVGLGQNRCEIFLFLDDDVELEPDFIEQLLRGYVRHPQLTGLSGIITNYKTGRLVDRLWHGIFMRGPFRDDRQSIYHRADELRGDGIIEVSRLGGGLMSFRTAATGGLRFDEHLRGASEGEDVDYCLQLPTGSRLAIDPNARLVHKASPTARADEHWIAAVVRGNSFLYYKNWRKGPGSRVAFAWLMTGFSLLALLSCAKRRSFAPWRSMMAAKRYGHEVASGRG